MTEFNIDNIHKELRPDLNEVYEHLGEDPAKYLFAFLAMAQSRRRYQIGFDREALEWVSRAWGEAASCLDKGHLKEACLHERDRYRHLADTHIAGEMERREEGVTFLNKHSDWPRINVIKAAIEALATAGVRSIQ